MSEFQYTVNAYNHVFNFTEIGSFIYVNTTMNFLTKNDVCPTWKQKIEEIQGVVRIEVFDKHQLSIQKGNCFKLQEIADRVVNILGQNINNMIGKNKEIVTMFNHTFNSSIGHTFKFTEDVNNSNFVLIDTTMDLPINIYDEATLLSPLFPILKIKGIADIEIINKYSLKIEKGSCFEWMEIAKQVIEFLDKLQNTSTESLASLTE